MHLSHVTYHEILLTAFAMPSLPPSPRVPHPTGPSSGSCQLVVATSSGHVFCSIQRWLVIDKVKKIQFYLLQYFIIAGQIGICAVRATDHRLLEPVIVLESNDKGTAVQIGHIGYR